MVLNGEDAELEELVKELGGLFNQQQTYVQPATPHINKYQAPIKEVFYNSGGFTPSAATPNHPQGHAGVDMRASTGTAVYPLAPGVVTNVGTDPKGGNIINITHPDNVKTYYAHLGTAVVHKGDKVDYNTIIGTVGNTGNARLTWPHLHFQVWKDGQLQNPANFFAIPKYTNVDKNKEKWWASEESKNEAQTFNMKQHIQSQKTAANIDDICKLAQFYYNKSKY